MYNIENIENIKSYKKAATLYTLATELYEYAAWDDKHGNIDRADTYRHLAQDYEKRADAISYELKQNSVREDKSITVYRIIHVETQTFIQGSYATLENAETAKIKMTQADFLTSNEYRVIRVTEIKAP